jgi:hypothetical protein
MLRLDQSLRSIEMTPKEDSQRGKSLSRVLHDKGGNILAYQ